MMQVSITGVEELERKLAQLGEETRSGWLEAAMRAGALIVQNDAKERAPKKTRNLSRSIHHETVQSDGWTVEVAVGTDVEYAAIHEFGGPITPKNAKYLAIPLTGEARQCISPRNFPGELRPIFSHSGSGVLVDAQGNAQYALRSSVYIPARPYLRPALLENKAAILEAIERVLRQLLDKYTR